MSKVTTAAILGAGAALVVVAALAVTGPWGVARPEATGDAGVLLVYAQTAFGPVKLVPDEPRQLARPQDFAFQFTCHGTGPRVVRIELVYGDTRELMHEGIMKGPAEMESLEYLLHLDDRAPNEATIVTTVESPHDLTRVVKYPVRLAGH